MKNWKTSLAGILVASVMIGLQMYQSGTTDVKTILTAVGVAMMGMLSKDFDKSHTQNK